MLLRPTARDSGSYVHLHDDPPSDGGVQAVMGSVGSIVRPHVPGHRDPPSLCMFLAPGGREALDQLPRRVHPEAHDGSDPPAALKVSSMADNR